MRAYLLTACVLAIVAVGCEPGDKPTPIPTPESPRPAVPAKPVEGKRTALNEKKTLFLEVLPDGRRRVVLQAEVCLREGPLELLLCRSGTKEHEAILRLDADAQQIHGALLAAKAQPGSPAQYLVDRIIPPHGTTIKVTLRYEKKPGEIVDEDAKRWIRNMHTGKPLEYDWVFGGSRFWKDEEDPKRPPYYLANNGDVISIANFPDSMLDLPVASSKNNAELAWECWTERIPPLETKVTVLLDPVLDDDPKK